MSVKQAANIKDIKQKYLLQDIISQYGIELKRKGQDSLECFCPFHKEKTPSFKVTPSKQLFNCFGCDAGGDIIRFVELMEKVSTKEAIKKLNDGTHSQQAQTTSTNKRSLLKDVIQLTHNAFKENKCAQQYLESRGLNDKELWSHFQIGYFSGSTIKSIVSKESQQYEQLKDLGLLNEKGNESFYQCISIPLKSEHGHALNLYGRSLQGKRHHYLKGAKRGVFNGITAKSHKQIIITESIIDTLSLIQIGYPNTTCIFGVNGYSDDIDHFIKNHDFEEIIFCLDNDQAGEDATQLLKEKVSSYVTLVSQIHLPRGIHDPNDFIVNGGDHDEFEKLIQNRSFLIDNRQETEQSEESSPIVKPIEVTKEYVLFKFDELCFQVRATRSKALDVLKAVITAYNTDSKYTDNVNLYSARNRNAFANAIANRLYVQSAKVEDDLYKIIAYLEYQRVKELEGKLKQSEIQMTLKEKKIALDLLQSKSLMKSILQDIKNIGYVGQEKEIMLLYTSFISTLNEKQIHISIHSSSSSGKSHALSVVSSCFPQERVQLLSRMSSQSLYYGDSLDGQVIILDERSAADEQGMLALRSMMSRGRLSLNVVQRDATTGLSRTEKIDVSAKACVWDADTDTTMEDNMNRSYQVYLDESSVQTKKIHSSQVDLFDPTKWIEDKNLERIRNKHRCAIRLLKAYKVEIPYAKHIHYPHRHLRSRRDFLRFLNLISCVTLLYQYQRTIKKTEDGIEYITATLQDYDYAYRMINDIVSHTYSPINKESKDLLEIIHKNVCKHAKQNKVKWNEFVFNRKNIREWVGWSEFKTRSCMKDLQQLDFVTSTGRQGLGYKYKLNTDPSEFAIDSNGLTTPGELKEALEKDELR